MHVIWLQFAQIYCLTRILISLHINRAHKISFTVIEVKTYVVCESRTRRAYRLIPNVMDGAMKESMISFLDKNLSIRLAKVRRPIEGVTRYAILILQC